MGKSNDSTVEEIVHACHDHSLHVGPEEEADLLLPQPPKPEPSEEPTKKLPPVTG